MHGVDHVRVIGDIAFVPQVAFDRRGKIGAMVDAHFFRRDHCPAALGFDPAHGGHAAREAIAHSVAMRHLVKSVARRNRADIHRLEQNIENGIASTHGLLLLILAS